MIDGAHYDPLFLQRVKSEEPRLWPNHVRLVRRQYEEDVAELARLDARLELQAVRRRAVLARMARARARLWPGGERRWHRRRVARVAERELPPPVVDAEPLWGVELRRVMGAVLRRHGPVSLRELHGLLHRYGYEVAGPRPVQRLGDAAMYEVRAGRLVHVSRGVYGPGVVGATGADEAALGEPLTWEVPADQDEPGLVDPGRIADPERWSARAWPASAQLGSDYCGPPTDPRTAELAEDLDLLVGAARRRLAADLAERDRRRASNPRPAAPSPPPPPASPSPSQPFGDDSSTNRRQRSETEDREGVEGGVDGAWWLRGDDP